MKKDNVTLKSYFETGDYPTEAQFIDLIDSFLNIEEKDAVTGITDNGDNTYTFQLLSGDSITVDGGGIPDDIPIANIIGLQNTLDNYVDLSNNQTVGGEKIWSTNHQFNGRIGVGNFPFGPNRLGDGDFQAESIDTKAINWKDDNQGTIAAIFTNPSGTVMTIKGFDDSVMVTDFTSKAGIEGTDPHESTIANTIEHTNGAIFINDQGVQSYPGATTPVANAFFQVLQNRGGGARKPYWFGYYDGTTYEAIWEVDANGVVTFNQVTKGKDGVDPEDFVTKSQLDAIVSGGNFLRDDQDETTTGSLNINLNSLSVGDRKSFGIGLPGNDGYFSMDSDGSSILGNSSANDGANSHIIVKRNGDFELNDNGTTHTVWHSGNDGSGSGLDADTLDGVNSNGFVKRGVDESGAINGGYLIFNYSDANNVDAISFNDTSNGYYFNADVAKSITSANANVHANNFYANGTAYFGDGKEVIRYSDGWLRLNPDNDFTSGIYCGTGKLRTDGQFEVGSSGDKFKVTSTGTVTAAGNITANSDLNLKRDVRPLEDSILEKILKMVPSTYKWKDKKMDQDLQTGFIAQEVQKQFPEWVHQGEEHLSLCYDKMAAVLAVKGIQELYAEIKKLKEEIKKLSHVFTD